MMDPDRDSTVNQLPSVASGSIAEDLLDAAIEQFELAHLRGETPEIDDFLQGSGPERETLLWELIHTDLEHRLRADSNFGIEFYLRKYRHLFVTAQNKLELVAAEWYCRRREHDAAAADSLLQRFPELRDAILQLRDQWPPVTWLGTEFTRDLRATRHFGRFQLLEEVGSGAFSTVWKAHDPDLSRIVALKLLRLGQLTHDQDVQRFMREARCAANLKHPAIVPVLEAGRTPNGCYLVSEFFPGGTLARRISSGKLSAVSAAEMTLELCNALTVAHSAGIIHRDIKPSNILLDDQGRPHLTDFGLATSSCADETLTRDGQLLGTPAYMAPEQAAGRPRDVGPWSDTYSLGVVLYEMLTAHRPFIGDTHSILKQICETPVERPRRYAPDISPDLENVCLKALEKDPAQRYKTAEDFADDIRRFLDGRPVSARRLGPLARLRKWSAREPLLAGLLASVLSVIVVALITVTWQWRQAEQNRQIALKNLNHAREAVDYFTTFIDRHLAETPNSQPLRRQLLERALTYYDTFIQQSPDDPASQRRLAMACFQAGEICGELGSAERAFELHRRAVTIRRQLIDLAPADAELKLELARSYYRLGGQHRDRGAPAPAIQQHLAALELRESVLEISKENVELQQEIIWSYLSLGQLYAEQDQLDEALRFYQNARGRLIAELERVKSQEPLVAELRRDLATTLNRLGLLLTEMGQRNEAANLHLEAMSILQSLGSAETVDLARQRAFAETYHYLGLLERDRDAGLALQHFKSALEIRSELVRLNPAVARYLADLGNSSIYVAQTLRKLERREESLVIALSACDIHKRLLGESPNTTIYQARLAQALGLVGRTYFELERLEEARIYLQSERLQSESLLKSGIDIERMQRELAVNAFTLAGVCLKEEKLAEALQWCDAGDQYFSELAKVAVQPDELFQNWAKFLDIRTVKVLRALDQHDQAEQTVRRAENLRAQSTSVTQRSSAHSGPIAPDGT